MELSYAVPCSYRDGLDRLCRCDLYVYRDEDAAVVVASEREDNPGASITNTYEDLATRVWEKLGARPRCQCQCHQGRLPCPMSLPITNRRRASLALFSHPFEHPVGQPLCLDDVDLSIEGILHDHVAFVLTPPHPDSASLIRLLMTHFGPSISLLCFLLFPLVFPGKRQKFPGFHSIGINPGNTWVLSS